MPRPLPALGIALLLALTAGCGAERAEPPSFERTSSPGELTPRELNEGDVVVDAPANWAFSERVAPGVATVATGRASFTIWAYPAAERVQSRAQAEAAAERLRQSLAERAPDFEVVRTRVVSVSGAPAVELLANGEIGGRDIRVRSVHVYVDFTEYVFDAVADPAVFEQVNRSVFAPAIASLELGGTSGALAPGAEAPESPALEEEVEPGGALDPGESDGEPGANGA